MAAEETTTDALKKACPKADRLQRARWAAHEIALRYIPAGSAGDTLYHELREFFEWLDDDHNR